MGAVSGGGQVYPFSSWVRKGSENRVYISNCLDEVSDHLHQGAIFRRGQAENTELVFRL